MRPRRRPGAASVCFSRTKPLTREKYVACVQDAADALRKGGFFSDKTAAWYVDQAKTAEIAPKSGTQ